MAARTRLITFLGKGIRRRDSAGYKTATYEFDDRTTETSRIFGVALVRHLKAIGRAPKTVLVVGTSGSDWDIFYEELGLMAVDPSDADRAMEEVARFSALATSDDAETDALAPLAQRLSRELGLDCRCLVIPYGTDGEGQVEILKRLAAEVQPGDRVLLDVTHGLRHLPVIGLISALYLRVARNAEIETIYYGALDRRGAHPKDFAPVLNLTGLLAIADWVGALETFDKDGDYGVLASLLRREGVAHEAVVPLRHAAFLERTARLEEARQEVNAFRKAATDLDTSPGVVSLFAGSLAERLAWVDAPDPYARQKQLAYFHLDRGDYLRAAVFGNEAFITGRIVAAGRKGRKKNVREAVMDEFFDKADALRQVDPIYYTADETGFMGLVEAHEKLSAMRNAMAHVDAPKRIPEVLDALRSDEKARKAIRTWLDVLLPDAPPRIPS